MLSYFNQANNILGRPPYYSLRSTSFIEMHHSPNALPNIKDHWITHCSWSITHSAPSEPLSHSHSDNLSSMLPSLAIQQHQRSTISWMPYSPPTNCVLGDIRQVPINLLEWDSLDGPLSLFRYPQRIWSKPSRTLGCSLCLKERLSNYTVFLVSSFPIWLSYHPMYFSHHAPFVVMYKHICFCSIISQYHMYFLSQLAISSLPCHELIGSTDILLQ